MRSSWESRGHSTRTTLCTFETSPCVSRYQSYHGQNCPFLWKITPFWPPVNISFWQRALPLRHRHRGPITVPFWHTFRQDIFGVLQRIWDEYWLLCNVGRDTGYFDFEVVLTQLRGRQHERHHLRSVSRTLLFGTRIIFVPKMDDILPEKTCQHTFFFNSFSRAFLSSIWLKFSR